MELIVRPRGGGKTHTIMQAMEEHEDAILVVESYQSQMIMHRIYGLALERIRVADYNVLSDLGRDARVYVDNADSVLRHLLGAQVEVASVTGRL